MSKKIIPYARQNINDDDIQAVVDVLQSDYLTQGPTIENLEQRFAAYCGVKYAVAVSSATAGLHIAYAATLWNESQSTVADNKRVWTSANTYVATANAALYSGFEVDFIDINLKTYNICMDHLKAKLEQAEKSGSLPDLVVPVHIAGQSTDMKSLFVLSEQYGFKIVEDAAHCIGAEFNAKRVGVCEFSNACVFSLHPAKIITSGEGGIVTTNDESVYKRLLLLRSHGVTRDASQYQDTPDGSWYFEQSCLGFHYRMTDIQAALALSQLDRVDSFVEKRNDLALNYDSILKPEFFSKPMYEDGNLSSWHLYIILLSLDKINVSKEEVFDRLRYEGIYANVHYKPVYLQPFYKKKGFNEGLCPNAERYYERAVTLPLYYDLTFDDQAYIRSKLQSALQ